MVLLPNNPSEFIESIIDGTCKSWNLLGLGLFQAWEASKFYAFQCSSL